MKHNIGFLVGIVLLVSHAMTGRVVLSDDVDPIKFVETSPASGWSSGFDIVIAKPLFSNNLGLRESVQISSQQFQVENMEFDYDYQTSPRVWIAYQANSDLGLRVSWWQFANQANEISLVPAANGFGRIEHPSFGDIDISAITPTERLTANGSVDGYAIDLELTRLAPFGAGDVQLSGGIRFASLDQKYAAQLLNSNSNLAGSIDYRQNVRGIGPTIAATVSRDLTDHWCWHAAARGSLLVGEGQERLEAGEDLDFVNPQRTSEIGQRDQLLPMLDLQLGTARQLPCIGRLQPSIRGGWDVSWWGDVGNHSGGESDLGVVGFSFGIDGCW